MPSARGEEFRRAAMHGGGEIGPPLFHKILAQLGVSVDGFRKLQWRRESRDDSGQHHLFRI